MTFSISFGRLKRKGEITYAYNERCYSRRRSYFAQRCRRCFITGKRKDTTTLKEMIEFVINSQDPEMAEKYSLRPGIGLAAPQIGVSKK